MERPRPDNLIRTLSPADAQAVDAALERLVRPGSAATGPVTPPEAARDRKVAALLQLLGQLPVAEPPADLTQRTLARIEDHEQQRRLGLQIQNLAGPAPAFRWRELLAVAAVLLIGLSILYPVLEQTRNDARRVTCSANLGAAGLAMSRYASENQGYMPRIAGQAGNSWATVGRPSPNQPLNSNSANLYLLVRNGFVTPQSMSCPGRAEAFRMASSSVFDWPTVAAVPYSYQNQFGPPVRLDQVPTLVVMVDRNPLFGPSAADPHRVIFRREVERTSNSLAHGGRGQNVLHANGVVSWNTTPVLANGDNIWLAQGVTDYKLVETPSAPDDSFNVP